jgi:succinyl-diaminopimelate desuccinylase
MIDHDALIAFTQELVRIPSVFDPATGRREEPAAELVAAKMRSFGWEPEIDEVAPGRPNVIAVIDGGQPGPTLLFEGHTDVVTEGDPGTWTVDPFGAEIIDGRLYGRGSADMKSGVAAMLFAAKDVADGGPFPGRIVVAALVDEEGMMLGAKHFVSSGRATLIDGAICCEPEAGEVCHTAKGALRLRVDFHGKMAHGAMPHQGRNPNAALARFVIDVETLEAALQAQHGVHPYLGEIYLTPTVLRAGEPVQMNVMPGEAAVWLDVRTVPGVDHGTLAGTVAERARLAGKPAGVDAEVTVIDDRPAVELATDDPLVLAVCAAHETVTGEPARLGGVPGATDGTILTALGGIPSVVYGPGGKWIAHQADEFVEVDDIVRCATVFAEAARLFLAG